VNMPYNSAAHADARASANSRWNGRATSVAQDLNLCAPARRSP